MPSNFTPLYRNPKAYNKLNPLQKIEALYEYIDYMATSNGVPTFTPYSVPYAAASTGELTEDATGLSYNGSDLSVGHNNSGVQSGIYINGGRASITAALSGMLLNVGSGTAGGGIYDSTKAFTFQNRGNNYLRLRTSGVAEGPWTNYADFTVDAVTQTGDIEVTTIGSGFILKSPDGTRYKITVANGGTLTTTAL